MHFGDVADRARLHPLHRLAAVVPRVALVAHLRDDLRRLPRLARQRARFVDRPGQRLLHVDVLAEIERGHRDRRVHVIRRRDDDRVDVFLLLEHLAVVGVALLLRQILGGDALERRDAMLAVLARFGGQVGFEQPLFFALAGGVERRDRPLRPGVAPVDVAQRDDVVVERRG